MFIGWLIPIVIGTGNAFRQCCSRIHFVAGRQRSCLNQNLQNYIIYRIRKDKDIVDGKR